MHHTTPCAVAPLLHGAPDGAEMRAAYSAPLRLVGGPLDGCRQEGKGVDLLCEWEGCDASNNVLRETVFAGNAPPVLPAVSMPMRFDVVQRCC